MDKKTNPLKKAAIEFGEAPAVIYNNRIINYQTLAGIISALCQKLLNASVKRGNRIAFVSTNRHEEYFLILALIHLGAVICPLSKRYPQKILENVIDLIKPDFFIDFGDFNLPNINKINKDIFENISNIAGKSNFPEIDYHQDATIIFSSGTTSTPKGFIHSFENHYYSALGSNENIKLEPGDRWLLSLPLYHIGGIAIIFRSLIAGATVVFPDSDESLSDAVSKYLITHISLVPAQLKTILDSKYNLDSLKAVLIGGSHVPEYMLKESLKQNLPLHTTYGLTEAGSQVTTTMPNDSLENLITSGKLLNYRDLKISNDKEILIKGKTIFKEQIGSDNPFDVEDWYHTGDLGEIDENGYLKVIGRKDNMFISGGENIHPEEIEKVLLILDYIEDAIVVPIEDSQYGFRPVAFVKASQDLNKYPPDNINLEKFKCPVRYFEFPSDNTESMKINRKYLKELAQKLIKNS